MKNDLSFSKIAYGFVFEVSVFVPGYQKLCFIEFHWTSFSFAEINFTMELTHIFDFCNNKLAQALWLIFDCNKIGSANFP